MPTVHRQESVSRENAKLIAKEKAFGTSQSGTDQKQVGLELEMFPFLINKEGMPIRRLKLEGESGILKMIDALSGQDSLVGIKENHDKTFCRYPLKNGGFITFEGGGQIEISTCPFDSPGELLTHTRNTQNLLAKAFAEHDVVLLGTGIDRWHPEDEIKLQVHTPRQAALMTFFQRFGQWGNLMMTKTASIHMNFDLGGEETWRERWLLANLISPIITATFACSPSVHGVSTRARAWQNLEPTRIGFPCCEGSEADILETWSERVLKAKVIIFKLAPNQIEPVDIDISFAEWIANGHPVYGWPTVDDFIYHLSTFYFEVRPRRYIELRSCDMLPGILQPIPVTLVTTLLYEDVTRKKCLELLSGKIPVLENLWHRSAVMGLRDTELSQLAHQTWEITIEGMDRLPQDYLGEDNIKKTRDFLSAYTFVNKMPADSLQQPGAESIPRSWEWSSIMET
ncbi:glutamate-cysteine ligase family protein [Calothrix rhizosoleniae]|uniref:glutamate-cysteine ligase family protein n=1 Tax=Calothrix rhizosoleniae TaxID=888997 RepID=UPI000B498C7F|nr:glutamate-cysteine ligase family protein [Calothrix rhizosoleniae]